MFFTFVLLQMHDEIKSNLLKISVIGKLNRITFDKAKVLNEGSLATNQPCNKLPSNKLFSNDFQQENQMQCFIKFNGYIASRV